MEYQILFIYIYMCVYGDVWQLEERNFNQTVEVDGIKIISGFVWKGLANESKSKFTRYS